MLKIKSKRGNLKGSISRAASFAETVSTDTSLSMLENRLEKLEETWLQFNNLQDKLYDYANDPDFVDPEIEYAEYENKYFLAHSILKNFIDVKRLTNPQSNDSVVDTLANQQAIFLQRLNSSNAPSQSSISLPKISIPIFSGDYKDWITFKDMFTSSVDCNASLTATHKFYLLKSFLSGDASNLIKHIPISESNYFEAWDKLEQRYDRVHLIIQAFVQSFLSLPTTHVSNVQVLRKITDGADEVIRGLNALESNSRDPWLIFLLLQKLDSDTKQAWAENIGSKSDSTIHELLEFLQKRCICLESCASSSRSGQIRNKNQGVIRTHLIESNQSIACCPKCKDSHNIFQCKHFLTLSIDARRSFVKENSLCFNCLRQGHSSNKCKSTNRCKTCNSRHHSLVHQTPSSLTNVNPNQTPANSTLNINNSNSPINSSISLCSSINAEGNSSFNNGFNETILPTAIARSRDKQGDFQNVRILLDSGSQSSFITEETVQRLGLIRTHSRIPVIGVGSTSAGMTNGIVTLQLVSCYSKDSIEVQCHVVSKLTSLIPSSKISICNTKVYSSFTLADPRFNIPGPIDLLIGADKIFSVFTGSAFQIQRERADIIPTIFGHVICGNMSVKSSLRQNTLNSFCTQLTTSTQFDLEHFWRLEEVHVEPKLSMEDQRAEEVFVKTYHRLTDGRYSVQLLFKSDNPTDFGNSFKTALGRFKSLEYKLAKNPELKCKYVQFMREYLDLGHMKEIPCTEIEAPTTNCYYLPHHSVAKSHSSTTKIRVVFDASAKSPQCQSLNESLLIGQTHQRDIFSICIRFRRHVYTLSGDIEKMYRQIRISEGHTDFQRILWRESSDLPLKHYRLLTVTYGTACAPFLAIRTLLQLAKDSENSHPLASKVLMNDFYVDDVMTGADSIEEVTSLHSELVNLLRSGGFNLRKWTTNCWPLLLSLPEDQRELSPKDFEDCSSVKLLGLQWSPAKDSFSYKVNLSSNSVLTKRHILSESSKIYDPLGFLSPVVISVKIFFQELWKKQYKWDDFISSEHSEQWCSIRKELHLLENINIPRIMWKNKNNIKFHAFCDASLDAYAAVVYCVSEDSDGNVFSNIVAAKSKVSPIKVISLPRLELCGAVLLTRLVQKLKSSLQFKDMQVYAWTDSSIVLHWLSALPKKWSVFISNRTSEILSSLPRKLWNHVRSDVNPADCASRGISPSHLLENELWWSGPSWIRLAPSLWPKSLQSIKDIPIENFEERKQSLIQTFIEIKKPLNVLEEIVQNSSRYSKAIRVLAYVRRFVSNTCVAKADRNKQPLSSEELLNSKNMFVKFYQSQDYSCELKEIAKGNSLKRGNRLASLTPFLDKNGVLRVGGRIQESELSYSSKHPIILDKNSNFVRLIVEDIHKRYFHASVSQMFGILRQNFFVIGCRNLLRKVVFDCVDCFALRKTTSDQIMANLPADRVRFARPFSKVGVDYAGPITLRLARGRNPKFVKAYIALFVCFTTKAIHIELVGDLSSCAFLAALDRFASRRGKPAVIFSDNATNFHGSRRKLNEMFQLLLSQQHNNIVINHLAKDEIMWKFIPPSAPHFGGLWEAGVKSVKFHLKRVLKDHRLTYEEMYTLLTQIEALLNSRPMWPTSDMDPIALSPAHFLIGEPYTSVPCPDMCDKIVNPLTNWSLLQTMKQGFWKQWHSEYLTSLQQRPKWQTPKRDIAVGDVVMLKDINLPPSKWILGRVVNVHQGNDKRTRVATVSTSTGQFVRPIVKLAPLPFSERPEPFRGG